MNLPREFFAGDRNEFAFKLSFYADPDAGAGASEEEVLTWGSFEIWAGGQNLCAHTELNVELPSVNWYMLPVLEWLVTEWDILLHESRLPARNAASDAWDSMAKTAFPPESFDMDSQEKWSDAWQTWWNRHCFLAARSGGLFPNLFMRRWQDFIEVSWGPSRVAGQPSHYRFLAGRGYRRFAPQQVSEVIYSVIEGAIKHLRSAAPGIERFRALERAVVALRVSNNMKRMATLSQLDESLWSQLRVDLGGNDSQEAVDHVFGGQSTDLVVTSAGSAALMFGSVSPSLTLVDVKKLAANLVKLYSPARAQTKIDELARSEPLENSDERPWDQGYLLASDFIDELRLLESGQESVDVEAVCESLGIGIATIRLEDDNIRAVAIAGPTHAPAILLNENHPTYLFPSGKRFTIAHELCHLVFDRTYATQLALASGPWAPRDIEKRANSFAAQLLMPPQLLNRIRAQMNVKLGTRAGVAMVSKLLQTSFTATLEHLVNLEMLDQADRERVRHEIDERSS
jgi:Zn-dependent peptidase ImmA (M78 family)